jgi:uncharacterized integral membrane protein
MAYWKLILSLVLVVILGWIIAENAASAVNLKFFGFSIGSIPAIVLVLFGILIGALLAFPAFVKIYLRNSSKKRQAIENAYQMSGNKFINTKKDRPDSSYEPADKKSKVYTT